MIRVVLYLVPVILPQLLSHYHQTASPMPSQWLCFEVAAVGFDAKHFVTCWKLLFDIIIVSIVLLLSYLLRMNDYGWL